MINLTPIVKNILIACIVVFVVQILGDMRGFTDALEHYLVLHPSFLIFGKGIKEAFIARFGGFQPIQLVGYFFAHGSISHIFFNMFMLASLGPIIERTLGSRKFLEFYLFCGLLGGILITLFDPAAVRVVGASVPLSGILIAFAIYYPHEKLGIMFLPIQFEAKNFVIGIAVISVVLFFLGLLGFNILGGISHFGHLMGMVAGLLFFYVEKIRTQMKRN